MTKPKKRIVPTKKQLQAIYDLAADMTGCTSYMVHDEETGEILGRDSKLIKALEMFADYHGLKKMDLR